MIAGVVLAHWAGRAIARRLDVRWGHVRRVMPTLPSRHAGRNGAWIRRMRAAEDALLPRLIAQPRGVEADALAAEIGEDRALVLAVLEHLRQEVDCHLRVTRKGRLLHDFKPAALKTLAQKRRRQKPVLLGIYLTALFANLGAAWPVILLLFIAVSTLQHVAGGEGEFVQVGIVGIAMLFGLAAATLVFGAVMHLILTPRPSGPRLGRALSAPQRDNPFDDGGSWWTVFWVNNTNSDNHVGWGGSSSRSRSSSSSDDDNGGGAAQAILIIILVMIILACLFMIFVWARGIYRAIAERRLDIESLTPTDWVRETETVDRFERYLPTNDMVGRAWRALRRQLTRRRPADPDLGPRVLARAARRGGMVPNLEIALAEGLSPAESLEIGARLCAELDGEIRAINGEVVFIFPQSALRSTRPQDPDLWAEYFTFDQQGPHLRRKSDQELDKVPVNLVGLRAFHMMSLSRLTAGAWLMAASGWVLCVAQVPVEWNLYLMDVPMRMAPYHGSWGLLIAGLLFGMAIATTVLAAVTRYAVRNEAILGVRRDARRAAFQELVEQCNDTDARLVDLGDQATRIATEMEWAWSGVDAGLLRKEMVGVAADLDLEPASRAGWWQIDALRTRIEALKVLDWQAPLPETAEDDPVVYDTRLEIGQIAPLF